VYVDSGRVVVKRSHHYESTLEVRWCGPPFFPCPSWVTVLSRIRNYCLGPETKLVDVLLMQIFLFYSRLVRYSAVFRRAKLVLIVPNIVILWVWRAFSYLLSVLVQLVQYLRDSGSKPLTSPTFFFKEMLENFYWNTNYSTF